MAYPSDRELTKRDTLKAWIKAQGSASPPEVDTLLDELIGRASDEVKAIVGWPQLLKAERSDTYSGTGRQLLTPPVRPIHSVVSLKVDGVDIPQRQAYGQHGWVHDGAFVLLDGYRFTSGVRNVEVTWTVGIDPTNDPTMGVLEQLTLHLATAKWKNRGKEGLEAQSLVGGNIQLAERELPRDLMLAVKRLRSKIPAGC